MVYDRYFGWDWDRIRGLAFGFLFLNLILVFIIATEGKPWYLPYQYIANYLAEHVEATIIGVIIFALGAWYWWKFEQGEL